MTIRDVSIEGENGVGQMHNLDPTPGPAGPDKRRRVNPKRAAVHTADTWHVDDGTAADGGPRYHKTVRRVFTPEYKLAILAEYDRCTETGEKGAHLAP